MAVSKYKRSLKKKLNSELGMIVIGLRKENASLKKTLVEFANYLTEHNKLLEIFCSLEAKKLENCQLLAAKDEEIHLPPEDLCTNEQNVANDVSTRRERTPTYEEQIEEINNKIEAISAKCHYLESRVTGNQDSTSNEQTSPSDGGVSDLLKQLSDALEKVEKWQQYDQEREAFVKFIFQPPDQLHEAPQTCSHHEDHSAENRPSQNSEYYENILRNLREELEVTHQKLVITQRWCREKDKEMEEIQKHLHSKMISKQSAKEEDHHDAEAEDPPMNDATTEPQHSLQEEKRKEKRKSASFELQAKLFQGYMLNHYHADKEKIETLERQLKISAQDLEDERRNCSYLKGHIYRILKVMRKAKGHVKKQYKNHRYVVEEEEPASTASSRDSLASSSHSSLLNESILECPSCQAQYPAGRYQELLCHLERCFE